MSHTACNYVKYLRRAPNGQKITVAEKAVLGILADYHRDDMGCAWPSVKKLAECSCVGERWCREILARLEQKGVIRRVSTSRQDGGQSSNEYIFPALDSLGSKAKADAARQKFQRVKRRRPEGTSVHPPRKDSSGGAGNDPAPAPGTIVHGRPGTLVQPIEPLVESSLESASDSSWETGSPISPSQASGELDPHQLRLIRIAFGSAQDAVHDALMRLTPPAFEKRRNFRNGAVEWGEYRFGDLTVHSCEPDPVNGLVLALTSPDATATARGLEKYKARWDAALQKAFGQSVRLVLRPGAESASSKAALPELPATGDPVPISAIIHSVMGGTASDGNGRG